MYLLDTDHASLIARGGPECRTILRRLSAVPPSDVAVSIISYEEQVRGWFAEIAACRSIDRQPEIYAKLTTSLQYYGAMTILPLRRSSSCSVSEALDFPAACWHDGFENRRDCPGE
jgi:tRNA(fMet)-specific endonuclease VapC